MIDSHCHLADEAFADDLDEVIARARTAGVTGALCILSAGDDAKRPRRRGSGPCGRRSALRSASIRTTPGSSPAGSTTACASVRRACRRRRTGHRRDRPRLPLRFLAARRAAGGVRAQVRLARELALPVIIHTREATDDTFAILREAGGSLRGVFHCFTGDAEMARAALDIGFYVSLAGIVTFPRAEALARRRQLVPADRLLIETDAPYLAPVPHRGKRNEPAFVARVAERVAAVRGVTGGGPRRPGDAQLRRLLRSGLGPTVSQQTA